MRGPPIDFPEDDPLDPLAELAIRRALSPLSQAEPAMPRGFERTRMPRRTLAVIAVLGICAALVVAGALLRGRDRSSVTRLEPISPPPAAGQPAYDWAACSRLPGKDAQVAARILRGLGYSIEWRVVRRDGQTGKASSAPAGWKVWNLTSANVRKAGGVVYVFVRAADDPGLKLVLTRGC